MTTKRYTAEELRLCPSCNANLPQASFQSKTTICRSCKAVKDKGRVRHREYAPGLKATHAQRMAKRRWQARHNDPVKDAARQAVRREIEAGRLAPPHACSSCGLPAERIDGKRAIQAHHHNGYENPLDVIWLCPKCHRIEHDTARTQEKASD